MLFDPFFSVQPSLPLTADEKKTYKGGEVTLGWLSTENLLSWAFDTTMTTEQFPMNIADSLAIGWRGNFFGGLQLKWSGCGTLWFTKGYPTENESNYLLTQAIVRWLVKAKRNKQRLPLVCMCLWMVFGWSGYFSVCTLHMQRNAN